MAVKRLLNTVCTCRDCGETKSGVAALAWGYNHVREKAHDVKVTHEEVIAASVSDRNRISADDQYRRWAKILMAA